MAGHPCTSGARVTVLKGNPSGLDAGTISAPPVRVSELHPHRLSKDCVSWVFDRGKLIIVAWHGRWKGSQLADFEPHRWRLDAAAALKARGSSRNLPRIAGRNSSKRPRRNSMALASARNDCQWIRRLDLMEHRSLALMPPHVRFRCDEIASAGYGLLTTARAVRRPVRHFVDGLYFDGELYCDDAAADRRGELRLSP